jgi:hypothetical protein
LVGTTAFHAKRNTLREAGRLSRSRTSALKVTRCRRRPGRISGALIIALGVFFVLTPFIPALNKEWRPEALMRRAGRAARSSPGWRSRSRGRRAPGRR